MLRCAMRADSALQPLVRDGLAAVEDAHREYFEQNIRTTFEDSLDLDEAMRVGHERENRWDYLLGHAPSSEVVGVEPHSAKQDEISTIISKRAAAKTHLREHLRNGVQVSRWLWVASGNVQFADTEGARLRLDQNGIEFVGRRILAKHLAGGPSTMGRPRRGVHKRR
ncbi:MAG: hypothetical protein ACXW5J_16450 [Thermoanaerobaculia bacterium]